MTTDEVIVGIDPGLTGGIAALGPDSIELHVMPVVRAGRKRSLDERAIVAILRDLAPAHTVIEHVNAMPGQGVVSMFRFGTGWGLVRGICAGLGLPYELARPQAWQRTMLAGHARGSEYLVASRLWPEACWLATPRSRKPHSGLVDAALIAEFGRRRRGR